MKVSVVYTSTKMLTTEQEKIRNFVNFRARAAAKVVKSVFSMCYNFSKNIIRKCLCTHWTKSQNFTRIIVKKQPPKPGMILGKN